MLRKLSLPEFERYLEKQQSDQAALEFDDAAKVLTIKWSYQYHIAYDRIDRPEKLLRWMVHLSEKRWTTKERLVILAEACGEHFGYQVRGA